MTAIFGHHAPVYADAGLPTFPVDTRAKKPRVKRWQETTLRHSRAWARSPELGAADGLGLLMGKRSGIVEIDVDAVGTAWVGAALDHFGDTPVVIQTASRKHKLWYTHNREGRHIRPFNDWPIDVLGEGFSICPPSARDDLETAYRFLHGSLADLDGLPMIREGAFDLRPTRAAEGVLPGMRNNAAWRYAMAMARHCDDVEQLFDDVVTWATAMPDPLPLSELEKCARSAWRYEATGRNFLGLRKPQFSLEDVLMDQLLDQPEAFVLYQMFRRWHGNRQHFAIAPRAMSEAGSPPWSRRRIAMARDVLIERKLIEEVRSPSKEKRQAGLYRLSDRLPTSGHNHYTPAPPTQRPGGH